MRMNLNVLALAAVTLAALPLTTRAAEGAYIGVEAGANQQKLQRMYQSGFNFVNLAAEKPFDSGRLLGLKTGWAWNNGLRAEFEWVERSNDLKTFTARLYDGGGSLEAGGHETASSAFVNLWYDFKPTVLGLRPYVGAGVGRTRVKVHDMTAGGVPFGSADASVSAYQLGAGVSYALCPKLDLSLDFRRLRTKSGNFGSIQNIPAGDAMARYDANSLSVGLNYAF